jgi:hypothetical protein
LDKIWIVEFEGKKHLIEISFPVALTLDEDTAKILVAETDGQLLVDGNEVQTFKAISAGGMNDIPKEISFEIAGKPAVLHKKGIFVKLELFFEGQQIKPAK